MTEIGEFAFSDCSGLTSITLSDRITKIGDGVFCGCSHLTSMVLPNSVAEVNSMAFVGCDNLTSITWKGKVYGSVNDFFDSGVKII